MVDLLVFFILVLFFWSLLWVSHPLPLGGVFLFISLVAVVGLCFDIGAVPAFGIWLVFISGVLVVFAYSFSLVPFDRGSSRNSLYGLGFSVLKGKGTGKNSGGEESKVNVDKKFIGEMGAMKYIVLWWMFILMLCFVMYLVGINESMAWSYYYRSEGFYYSSWWSIGVVGLGVYLLVVMIGSVTITSNYQGALIK